MDFGKQLSLVRERAPLVQCITNFVTVNDCANIVLAAGGSPSMADDVREAAEAVQGAAALVCNLGAIAAVDAMLSAGKTANELDKPVVLDPVAAGNTALRRASNSPLSGATLRRSGRWPGGSGPEAAWMSAVRIP